MRSLTSEELQLIQGKSSVGFFHTLGDLDLEDTSYSLESLRLSEDYCAEKTVQDYCPLIGIVENLAKGSSLRLMDFGCGKGDLTRYLFEEGHDVVGVEPDPISLGLARKNLNQRVVGSLRDLPKVGFYDLVLAHRVFEEPVLSVEQTIVEIKKLSCYLSKKGRILISTLNGLVPRSKWGLFGKVQDLEVFPGGQVGKVYSLTPFVKSL